MKLFEREEILKWHIEIEKRKTNVHDIEKKIKKQNS